MTKYEKEILNIVNVENGHMSADRIFEKLKEKYPSVSLATVYNNVNKLWNAGLIRKLSVEGLPDKYDSIKPHDHLVCKKCGRISDIRFDDMTDQIRQKTGEEFLFYDLKVFYICPECRAKHII